MGTRLLVFGRPCVRVSVCPSPGPGRCAVRIAADRTLKQLEDGLVLWEMSAGPLFGSAHTHFRPGPGPGAGPGPGLGREGFASLAFRRVGPGPDGSRRLTGRISPYSSLFKLDFRRFANEGFVNGINIKSLTAYSPPESLWYEELGVF